MPTDISTLISNLKLVRSRYPGVHRRLSQRVVNSVLDGLYQCEDDSYAYMVKDEKDHSILVKESPRDVTIDGKRLVIVLGVGLGYQLFEIFEQLKEDQLLVAVEARPELLCKSLYVHDWSELIRSDRFRLYLGPESAELDELAESLGSAPSGDELLVLDNKVLVTIDQKPYAWWNLYFYLLNGLDYDGIRVINAVMKGFNLWDPDNLFLNLPDEFLGRKPSELDPHQIYGRFNTLARALAPGLRTLRKNDFPFIKASGNGARDGRVSVIVLCWNKREYTVRCIRSLLENTDYPNLQVIAVDNGSIDGTPEMLEHFADEDDRLVPVLLESNIGIPAGRQKGLERADGNYILFMDNDTEVERPDFLQIMVRAMRTHQNVGSTGAFPIIYTSDEDDSFIQCVHVPGITAPVAWCSGYCLMVRRSALEEIGGIDADDFEKYGAEDVYLGYKLREHGWMTVSTPALVGVTHHIAHRHNYYDYDWQETGRSNSELFLSRFGKRRRLLNAALDNCTAREASRR